MSNPNIPEWSIPNTFPELSPGEIHVWMTSLHDGICEPESFSREERLRLNGMHNETIRQRYCVTRSTLRRLMAAYLDQPLDRICIETGKQGKPYIPGSILEFNISHTTELILMAFAYELPVGIDCEASRPLRNHKAIAQRLFGEDEYRQWVEAGARRADFYRLWTTLEARQKCQGEGLFGKPIATETVVTRSFPIKDGITACLAWQAVVANPVIRYFSFN